MNTQLILNLGFIAILLGVYVLYIHKPLMQTVNAAKEISDRKKQPEQNKDTKEIMDDVLVELDMGHLTKMAESYVANLGPDKNPLEELMAFLDKDSPKEEEENPDE